MNELKEIVAEDEIVLNKGDVELLKAYENIIIECVCSLFSNFSSVKNLKIEELKNTSIDPIFFFDPERFIKIEDCFKMLYAAEDKIFSNTYNEFSNEIEMIEAMEPQFDITSAIFHLKDMLSNIIFISNLDEALKAYIRYLLCSDENIYKVLYFEGVEND